jgi:hypothetical protein
MRSKLREVITRLLAREQVPLERWRRMLALKLQIESKRLRYEAEGLQEETSMHYSFFIPPFQGCQARRKRWA